MLLAIVGTHEQQFNRLVKALDCMAQRKAYPGDIFIQYGYSSYVPQFARGAKMLGVDELGALADQANIIVTHGGPGSIWLAFERNKIPVVVPRNARYGEHVNDHQIAFARHMEQANRLITVLDINELPRVITNYNDLAAQCSLPLSTAMHNRERLRQYLDKSLMA